MNIIIYLLIIPIMVFSNLFFYKKGREHQEILDNMKNPNNIKRRVNYEERNKTTNRCN